MKMKFQVSRMPMWVGLLALVPKLVKEKCGLTMIH